jgi:hypothetical protein
MSDNREMVYGNILLENILSEPLTDNDSQLQVQLEQWKTFRLKDCHVFEKNKTIETVTRAINMTFRSLSGNLEHSPLIQTGNSLTKSRERKMMESWKIDGCEERERATYQYASKEDSPFPPAPAIPKYNGSSLEEWLISAEPITIESFSRRLPKALLPEDVSYF